MTGKNLYLRADLPGKDGGGSIRLSLLCGQDTYRYAELKVANFGEAMLHRGKTPEESYRVESMREAWIEAMYEYNTSRDEHEDQEYRPSEHWRWLGLAVRMSFAGDAGSVWLVLWEEPEDKPMGKFGSCEVTVDGKALDTEARALLAELVQRAGAVLR